MEVSKFKCLIIVAEGFIIWQATHFLGARLISPIVAQLYPYLPSSTVATLTTSNFAPIVAISYMSLRMKRWFPKLSFDFGSIRGAMGGIILVWLGVFIALVFFDRANGEALEILALPKPFFYHGVISVAIWDPLLEETLSRGYLFEILRKKWSFLLSLFLSTLFFIVPHGIWGGWNIGLIWMTYNSIIYTLTYVEGGLWAAAITHIFTNSYILYLNL